MSLTALNEACACQTNKHC